ncbi:DUF3304 domain-containing protein [Massilia horti]|uniref:DUF3304 domain-containing protein n=1 Tax=Massilia horti TaxID=2562153 RepID=A0A4Y9T3M1_9BURK|nr:DUF3304 domain-containing protein [Massilia horti]TFW32109.1 DUF3304 domain-containing protein [Massilia horti]
MNFFRIALRRWRLLLLLLAVVSIGGYAAYTSITKEEFMPDSIGGVHHMGEKFYISDFFVNGYSGSKVGRGGGGGSLVCCVAIPKKWRPGLTADVRWEVLYFSDDEPGVPKLEAMYRAEVPVEKYDETGNFWVHFYPNGRIRIVVSNNGPGGHHPILNDNPDEVLRATVGVKINTLFTDEEVEAATRKEEKRRKNHGDWR